MRKQLIILIVVLAGAMVVSCMARAAGEAKNQRPFTSVVKGTQPEGLGEAKNQLPFTALVDGTQTQSQGEAKNDLPFTALVVGTEPQGQGEAKNDQPFTADPNVVPDAFERYAAEHPYGRGLATTVAASKSGGGVDWRYVIGSVAIGGALLIIGLAVLQSRRRSHTTAVLDV